jgi:hypothetical protein
VVEAGVVPVIFWAVVPVLAPRYACQVRSHLLQLSHSLVLQQVQARDQQDSTLPLAVLSFPVSGSVYAELDAVAKDVVLHPKHGYPHLFAVF